jgi:hypothetical protein
MFLKISIVTVVGLLAIAATSSARTNCISPLVPFAPNAQTLPCSTGEVTAVAKVDETGTVVIANLTSGDAADLDSAFAAGLDNQARVVCVANDLNPSVGSTATKSSCAGSVNLRATGVDRP